MCHLLSLCVCLHATSTIAGGGGPIQEHYKRWFNVSCNHAGAWLSLVGTKAGMFYLLPNILDGHK